MTERQTPDRPTVGADEPVAGGVDAEHAPGGVQRLMTRLLAGDRPTDLAFVVATFALYLVLDRLTRAVAVVSEADLDRPWLLGAALANRWWAAVAVLAVVAAAVILGDRGASGGPGLDGEGDRSGLARLLGPWSAVEHGSTLRLLAAPLIVLLAWQASLYDVNFLVDRVHGLDRIGVAALAIGALWRPVLLLPFAVAVRVVNEQFFLPFETQASKNVDELLIIALLGMAAGYLLHVATGRRDTSAVVLLIGTAVAAHFFWPGKGKLVSGWLSATDVSNLPLSSHAAGWLGGTDGGLARGVADLFAAVPAPVLLGTLAIELGAVVAVLHPRLLRLWIPGFVAFHTMTFITTGFFFVGWTILELSLLAILVAGRFRSWTAANATPARGLLAVAAVVGGTILFHPPGLAWFDAPVGYGYRIEVTGESGARYRVPIADVAPFDQELSFIRVPLTGRPTATGGYGAISTTFELDRLNEIDTFDELSLYEAELGPPAPTAEGEAFFVALFDHLNHGRRLRLFGLSPPDRFWTGDVGPHFDHSEPVVRLEVELITALHNDGTSQTERRTVLVIEADGDGNGVVTERDSGSG